MNFPTQHDWVSTILEELNELEIDLELEEIELLSKEKFKSIVNEKVEAKAFEYLINKKDERKSDNAKGKYLVNEQLEMAEYLTPMEEDLSISEKKWLLKCRIEDIQISDTRKWNNENEPCMHCPQHELDNTQLMNCQYLLGKNQILTYIPRYMDIFNGSVQEQVYASRILKENLTSLKAQQRTM